MAEILLSNQVHNMDSFHNIHDMYSLQLKHKPRSGQPMLIPYRPYLYSARPSATDQSILVSLEHHLVKKDFTDMALEFGEDSAIAIAEIAAGLRQYGAGAMGAATSIYSKRLHDFGTAVNRYQDALLEYRDVVKSNPQAAQIAKQKAIDAFQKMQKGFQREINTVTSGIRARKGLPLTSSTRALNIARSSRKVAKLHVADQVQASKLVQFGKYGKFLGNGLAVIDFGSRVGNVHSSYRAGEDWYREMFIESSSFAASAATGIIAAKAGSAVLGIIAVATPVTWVGLIVAGVAVAGIAATASIGANSYLQNNGGALYDSIMKCLNVRS